MAIQHIPPPDVRTLLPPLLECLSTASASKQPPEALIPLLSPILAQRVRLLASDDWLSLLCWDKDVAARLPAVVNAIHVEPHPVSGEVELEDAKPPLYRRSDAETLHARIALPELGLVVTYLWCTGGESGNVWKLSELRGVQDENDGTLWFPTVEQASEAGLRRASSVSKSAPLPATTVSQPAPALQEDEDDDDGSYWAAYDRTPGRTPARTPLHKPSPAPVTNSRTHTLPPDGPAQSSAELDYFARYADEVQPVVDDEDPEYADKDAVGESTLNGNVLLTAHEAPSRDGMQSSGLPNGNPNDLPSNGDHTTGGANGNGTVFPPLSHPRPSSPSSTGSVERLEREAEQSNQQQHAIKQHISTDIKSLFRLARSAGIDREEFERIIQRELEVLPMLEQDD